RRRRAGGGTGPGERRLLRGGADRLTGVRGRVAALADGAEPPVGRRGAASVRRDAAAAVGRAARVAVFVRRGADGAAVLADGPRSADGQRPRGGDADAVGAAVEPA